MENLYSLTAHVDGHPNWTTYTGTLLGFFYPKLLIDVAHAYKKSEQLYKGTWNITLIFQGRIQLAHPKAEGGKTESNKCSKQLWSRQLSF